MKRPLFPIVLLLAATLWGSAVDPARAAPTEVIPHAQDKPPGPPLSPQEAIAKMTVPEGFRVELVAAEPDIVNPVAMTFDERGRIWITESLEYPRQEAGEGRDRVKVLEDTDGDGRADKFTIFAEGLNIPSGIAVGYGGVWVANAPDILFLRDTDGDGRADRREVVVAGFGRDDTHELPNSLTWGPDGWLYGLNGVFNPSVVVQGGKRFEFTCALFRIHPRTREFQLFAEGTSNPWGVAWDSEGSAFVSACVIDHLWHLAETAYYIRQGGPYPPFVAPMRSIVDHKHQKAAYCGIHYFDSDAYPSEYRERLYMGNIHGNCINVDVLARKGSTYTASAAPDFLSANDAWFMPVVQKTGPDGCLYILDWYDRYHCYQDARRDPAGIDRLKGRLYRVRYGDAPRVTGFDLAKESDAKLIERLASPNVYFRDVAQRVLAERNDRQTRPRLEKLVLDSHSPRKARLHALWALVSTGELSLDVHLALLAHDEATFRAWGVRAAGNFAQAGKLDAEIRDKVARLLDDPAEEVRLQVATAARKLPGVDAASLLVKLWATGNDPVVNHVVWQNLHPLIAHDDSFVKLVTPQEVRRAPAVVEYMPRAIDRILAGGRPAAIVALVKLLAGDPQSEPSLEKCFAALAARRESRELSGEQIAALRRELDPIVQKILSGPAEGALHTQAALLAATWQDGRALAAVRAILASKDQPAERRARALDALVAAGDPSLEAAAAELFAAGGNPVELRASALSSLARLDAPWVARVILANYGQLEGELRPRAIEVLTQRRAWAEQLLDAIGREEIPAAALNANQVRQLLARGDSALAEKVAAHWGLLRDTRDSRREEVIARMRSFLRSESGDPHAGREVFRRVCGQCHKLHGEGQEVGPDITLNGRSSFEQLLSNVFDPNLVIGAAYQARTILTADGRVLTGLVAEESPERVVLKIQGGKQETIPRGEIEEMKRSDLSLMPEDLEKQTKPQELVDLFAYLTLDKPPGDPAARKLPGSHVPKARETSDRSQFAELVGEIAPGFTIARVGGGPLAIVAEHAGREGVLRTRPVHRQEPCVLRGKVQLSPERHSRLVLAVSHEPRGAWKLTVVGDGQRLFEALVGGDAEAPRWQTISVDLAPLAGKHAQLELVHSASGEAASAAYWGQVEVVSQ